MENGERIQTVVFVRHGVAKHNIRDPVTGLQPNIKDPSFFDAPLVSYGKQQAIQAGEQIQTFWRTTQLGKNIELVVTSPLTRCIQSAVCAFLPGDNYNGDNSTHRSPPIVCIEQVREAYGIDYPDKRRNRSLLVKHWPLVHFDPNLSETDIHWKKNKRETMDHLVMRVNDFFFWLIQRNETNIVVVSHGVWIETCFQQFCSDEMGNKRVHNCGCYAVECVSQNGKFLMLQNLKQI